MNRMNKYFTALFFISIFITGAFSVSDNTNQTKSKLYRANRWPFFVYHDGYSRLNHYIPSGWMGDALDVRYTDKWISSPKNGKTCIRIQYSEKRKQTQGWAGIYWQNPANNWGTEDGGYNLTGARQLSFWARGEKGGEMAEFLFGGITGKYADSTKVSTGVKELSSEWKFYQIDLERTGDHARMNSISGGFCVVFTRANNIRGLTIYIDEIAYTTNKIDSNTVLIRDSTAETK